MTDGTQMIYVKRNQITSCPRTHQMRSWQSLSEIVINKKDQDIDGIDITIDLAAELDSPWFDDILTEELTVVVQTVILPLRQ